MEYKEFFNKIDYWINSMKKPYNVSLKYVYEDLYKKNLIKPINSKVNNEVKGKDISDLIRSNLVNNGSL